MIREATHDDIPAIMEMGKRFADDAGVTKEVGWDDESVQALLTHLIDDEDGVLLIGERGMIGGLVFDHHFNRHVRVFQELFWRSEGIEGVKLLKRAEAMAKERGASRSIMISTANWNTGPLYERLGYVPGERIFGKDL